MKKILLFAVLFLAMTISVQAQKGERFQERVESMRIAFITKQLDLSPDEAQNFWPIYNQFRKEQKALRSNYPKTKNPSALSDAEAEDSILASFEREEKEVALKRKYYGQLKEVLPVQKIAMLKKAERQFKERLVKQLNEKKRQRRQQREENDGMK